MVIQAHCVELVVGCNKCGMIFTTGDHQDAEPKGVRTRARVISPSSFLSKTQLTKLVISPDKYLSKTFCTHFNIKI